MSRLLKLAHAIGRPALKQIPGAIPFFQILAEVTDYHKIMLKLEKMNLTMKEYDNHTIEDFLEDLAKNHNISLAQIPMNTNVSAGLLKHPAVKGLIKEAMSTQINGTPFAITLAFLMDHLYSEIRIHQLTNSTVLNEIKKNISEIVGPFIRIQISKHMSRLKSDYFGGFASLFKTFLSAS